MYHLKQQKKSALLSQKKLIDMLCNNYTGFSENLFVLSTVLSHSLTALHYKIFMPMK